MVREMRMKRIFSVCAVILVLFGLAGAAHAGQIEVAKDNLVDKYTVSGTVDEAALTGKVSVLAVSDDNYIVHAANVATDIKGSFSYFFMMPSDAPSGRYIVKVSAYGRTVPLSAVLDEFYVSETRKNEILTYINTTVSSADELRAYLSGSIMRELGLDAPRAIHLSESSLNKIYNEIYNKKPYSSVSDIRQVYYKVAGICALNEATSSNAADIWGQYGMYFDISSSVTAKLYSGYTEPERLLAVSRIGSGEINNESDIIKALDASVFLYELSKTKSYSGVNTLFDKYRAAVTFDLSKFDSLNGLLRGNALYGRSFADMPALKAAIDAINQNGSSDGSSSGGGSSGGGGSSSGGSYGLPVSGSTSISVPVEMAQKSADTTRFSDVTRSFWACEAIERLSLAGITDGYPDGRFLPDNNITREEFVSLIVRYLGLDSGGKICSFDDVPKSRWSYDAVAAAYDSGIIKGISENLFGAEQLLSRQDMAVIVARAAGVKYNDMSTDDFADNGNISDYAIDSVRALKAMGIISGFDDNTFRPHGYATRAEAVMMISRLNKGE